MTLLAIRQVTAADLADCHAIERRCFPAAEAASLDKIRARQETFAAGFLVATDGGRVVGFINSGATDEPDLACEEFKELAGHDPAGRHLVILSLAVAPDRQGRGISRALLGALVERARADGRAAILLLCKPPLVPYYERFGFRDRGPSASGHGGARWHEMQLVL